MNKYKEEKRREKERERESQPPQKARSCLCMIDLFVFCVVLGHILSQKDWPECLCRSMVKDLACMQLGARCSLHCSVLCQAAST